MKRLLPVFLPVAVLLLWTFSLEVRRMTGQEIRLHVEGYDPRDLLSGHYMRFRFAFTQQLTCPSGANRKMCVCLATSPDDARFFDGVEVRDCADAASSCPVFIRGECSGSRLLTGLERYYIPESLAPALMVLPSGSSAVVNVDTTGKAVLIRMLVGDEDIERYAERMLVEKSNVP